MSEGDKFRYELKYLCSETQLEIIKYRLMNILSFDHHTVDGQYVVRSIYFDNYENRCYFENENGTDPREKFRIRIYNADDKRISLECKRKEKGKTHKESCLITKDDYHCIMNGLSLDVLQYKSGLLKELIMLIKQEMFRPVVIVEYDRTPYVYPVGNVRITLDKNIRSSMDLKDFFAPNISTRPILPTGQHLLEVKYDELLPDYIKEVLQLDDLSRTAFSKYYLCRKFSLGGYYEY